jgi:hypothetical protein
MVAFRGIRQGKTADLSPVVDVALREWKRIEVEANRCALKTERSSSAFEPRTVNCRASVPETRGSSSSLVDARLYLSKSENRGSSTFAVPMATTKTSSHDPVQAPALLIRTRRR